MHNDNNFGYSLFIESDVELWSRLQYNVVSLAYISILNLLLTVERALIYIRNSNRPVVLLSYLRHP